MWIQKGCKVHNYLLFEDLAKIRLQGQVCVQSSQGGSSVFCTAYRYKKGHAIS